MYGCPTCQPRARHKNLPHLFLLAALPFLRRGKFLSRTFGNVDVAGNLNINFGGGYWTVFGPKKCATRQEGNRRLMVASAIHSWPDHGERVPPSLLGLQKRGKRRHTYIIRQRYRKSDPS